MLSHVPKLFESEEASLIGKAFISPRCGQRITSVTHTRLCSSKRHGKAWATNFVTRAL
jgi:hypothetical protein